MKFIKTLLFFPILLTACIKPSPITEDIDYLINTLEEVHPNLYAYTEEAEFNKQINELKNFLPDSLDKFGLWKHLAPVINSLNHGHTTVFIKPDEAQKGIDRFIKTGNRFLPLSVYIIDSIIYIKECENQIIPAGSIIESINDIKSEEILEYLLNFKFGEQKHFRIAQLEKSFTLDYSFNYPSEKFEIKYSNKEKKDKQILNGIDFLETMKLYSDIFSPIPDYDFEIIQKNTGIIYYNSCNDLLVFQKFCDSIFSIIEKKQIDNLIIDLRQNGGGSSSLNNYLFSFVYDKPYKTYEKAIVKISKEMSSKYKEYAIYKNDTLIEFHGKPQLSDKSIFQGNIYILTSSYTFSSGANCAMMFKDYGIGTIIGQKTGGYAGGYGDGYEFILPNSGLHAKVGYKEFYRIKGNKNKQAVMPHIETKRDIDYLISNKDIEMDIALKQIELH